MRLGLALKHLLLFVSLVSVLFLIFFFPEMGKELLINGLISFILMFLFETKILSGEKSPEEVSKLSIIEKDVKEMKSSLEQIESQLNKLSEKT